MFVCDAIREMTGVDPAQEFRNRYASRETAYQLIRETSGKHSVRAIAELVTTRFDMPEAPILMARRGDVVLIKRPTDYSLGILSLNGKEIVVTRAKSLCTIPISQGLLAWHV